MQLTKRKQNRGFKIQYIAIPFKNIKTQKAINSLFSNNLHISNPKLRRFFQPSRIPPRIFRSKNSLKIQVSQLFRNFAAFDNK